MISIFKGSVSPSQLGLELLALSWDYDLLVSTFDDITVCEYPFSLPVGLVALELAFEVGAILVCPFAFQEAILNPFPNVLHASRIKDICPLSMLLGVEPVPREDILVWIYIHPFSLLPPLDPLSIVLTLVSVYDAPNAMLEVGLELSVVNIAIRVDVLAFPFAVLN